MSNHPDWLPPALQYGDFNGDWSSFLDSVYQVFERDFKKSTPSYQGSPVTYDSQIEDGKEAVFWHIICRSNQQTKNRELDLRRCERIPWPKPMIEHTSDESIWVWKNERKRSGTGHQARVLIWLERLDYIVVLAEKKKRMILVTAYCTDIKSQREKLKKERDEYCKMQKPPGRAT